MQIVLTDAFKYRLVGCYTQPFQTISGTCKNARSIP